MYDKTEVPQDIEILNREIRELTRLLESSQDVFYRTDLQGRLTFITPSIERYAGYAPSELIGRYAHEVYADPEDRTRFVEELYRTGSVIDYGVRLVDSSGHIHFVSVNARTFSEDGQVAGVEGVMREITRRKLEQDAVQQSEELFHAVFDRGTVGIAMIDEDFQFKRVNPSFARMLGRSENELVGMNVADVTHPDDMDKGAQLALSLFRSEIPYYSTEKRYLHKNGDIIWAHLTAAAIPDRDGKPVLGLSMVKDISETRKFQLEREEMIVQLQVALANVKTLSGLLPMCSWCKKIRDNEGSWSEIEEYVKQRSDANFTHGICPNCQTKVRKGFWMGSREKDKDPGKR